jgi:hypothetical protein
LRANALPATFRHLAAAVLLTSLLTTSARAGEGDAWPREIETEKGTVVVYQPQPDTFENNVLTARSAISVTPKGKEPIFGAAWFEATVEVDREERMMHVDTVDVPRVRFPDATPDQERKLSEWLAKEMTSWEMSMPLDAVLASLETAEGLRATAENLATDPPAILFVDHLATLITIEGPPELREVEGTKLMFVVNSPQAIIFDPGTKAYYLSVDEHFLMATDFEGKWTPTEKLPKEVQALVDKAEEEAPADEAPPEDAETEELEDVPPPEVIVATEPTELIVMDGEATFTPLPGNDLLYMSNTDSDVFLEVETQKYFLPAAGRWYSAASLDGPWTFVAGDDLPAAFASIPEDSPKAGVLVHVPNTDAAVEAALDAQVPQTAAVNRADAKLEVEYDGDPEFKEIEGTDMAYAVNTSYSVLRIDGKFYCCNEAVWFVADKPTGPWVVTDSRPDGVDDIPPDNPHYNVRYVYIYDATPQVVYVGYTPGYTGCYVYHGCVVYGTGYHYSGWYGPYYYPRPVTYGFHMTYNPYYGWGCGFSYSTGRFTVSIHSGGYHRYGGWYGPPMYRPPYYRPPYYRPPGYRPPGYQPPYHRPPGYRPPAGRPPGQRPPSAQPMPHHTQNMYDRRANDGQAQVRDKSTRPTTGGGKSPAVTPGRDNNVYADRNGDVYKRDQSGCQKREGNSWKSSDVPRNQPSDRSTQPGTRPSQTPQTRDRSQPSPTTQDRSRSSGSVQSQNRSRQGSSLEQDHHARQRGTQRSQGYQQQRSRSHSQPSRSRGGGGGRRR